MFQLENLLYYYLYFLCNNLSSDVLQSQTAETPSCLPLPSPQVCSPTTFSYGPAYLPLILDRPVTPRMLRSTWGIGYPLSGILTQRVAQVAAAQQRQQQQQCERGGCPPGAQHCIRGGDGPTQLAPQASESCHRKRKVIIQ